MATLIISDVSFDDIGEYECIPSNSEGTHNSATTQLDVRGKFATNSIESYRLT